MAYPVVHLLMVIYRHRDLQLGITHLLKNQSLPANLGSWQPEQLIAWQRSKSESKIMLIKLGMVTRSLDRIENSYASSDKDKNFI